MPELPEVETVRKGLEKAIVGRRIAHVKLARADLRFPLPRGLADTVKGRRVTAVERRAKYLLIKLEGGWTLLAHLGMSGRFKVMKDAPEKPGKHDHVELVFADGGALVFNDARRFGSLDLVKTAGLAKHRLLAYIGPEPFSAAFNARYLREKLAGRKTAIKAALMDSALVAGVGNIYASEALYEARIDPRTQAGEAAAKAAALVASVRKVLKSAIASGGSSLRDFYDADGEAGYFQHHFKVYGREGKPCYACAGQVQKITQGTRSTYFCPSCQKGAFAGRGKHGDKPAQPAKTARKRGIKKSGHIFYRGA